jgi:hypothetical protein
MNSPVIDQLANTSTNPLNGRGLHTSNLPQEAQLCIEITSLGPSTAQTLPKLGSPKNLKWVFPSSPTEVLISLPPYSLSFYILISK